VRRSAKKVRERLEVPGRSIENIERRYQFSTYHGARKKALSSSSKSSGHHTVAKEISALYEMHPKLLCPSLSSAIDLHFRTRTPRGSVGIQIAYVSSHCRNDHRGANGEHSSKYEGVFHVVLPKRLCAYRLAERRTQCESILARWPRRDKALNVIELPKSVSRLGQGISETRAPNRASRRIQMSKHPSPRVDQLRAMREAKFARNEQRQQKTDKAATPAKTKSKTKKKSGR
jgi:hypothetical protein